MNRRILTILAAFMCALIVDAQTTDQLIKKWKSFKGAKSTNMTSNFKKALKSYKAEGEFDGVDYYFIEKNFKKMYVLELPELSESQQANLSKDIERLEGFEVLSSVSESTNANNDKGSDGVVNPIEKVMQSALASRVERQFYGRINGEYIEELLWRINIWDTDFICVWRGKAKADELMLFLMLKTKSIDGINVEENIEIGDSDDVSNDEIIKILKEGPVLVVTDGVIHPELKTEHDVTEYMVDNKIHLNHFTYITGKAVKKKYPKAKEKVVLECSNEKK